MEEYVRDALTYAARQRGNGRPADYMPEMKADPKLLGISVTGCDGSVCSLGDCEVLFPIQSVVKTVILAAALEDAGLERLSRVVGFEPTGEPFNSVRRHEDAAQKPSNPMINAGTFAAISVIPGDREEKYNRILNLLKQFAADDTLAHDPDIYAGEHRTGNRNRALAYLLLAGGIIHEDPADILDVHFKTSAVLVHCIHLGRIGAALANDGVNPVSRRRVISAENAQIVRTVMATCGMYNEAGTFAVRAGVPAKSGVSGDIMASVRNQVGIGAYSPELDKCGNSVCAMAAIQRLSKTLSLGIY